MVNRTHFLDRWHGGVFRSFVYLFLIAFCSTQVLAQERVDLSGTWRFQLDPKNEGEAGQWYNQKLSDHLQLPGSLQEQGFGNAVTAHTRWYPSNELGGIWATSPVYAKYRRPGNVKIFERLQPLKHYIGAAWYQRKITVPADWSGKQIHLFLERVHWSATVWIDGKKAGTQNSLATAQQYDLTPYLKAGSVHTLTIRVDNSQIINLGEMPHSVSDETQTAWNGIIGKILLQVRPTVSIADVQVYPDIDKRSASIRVTLDNALQEKTAAHLALQVTGPDGQLLKERSRQVDVDGPQRIVVFDYPMGQTIKLWDAFHPNVYRLAIRLNNRRSQDSAFVSFGMRAFTTRGTHFQINGQRTALRENVNCGIFPFTGYPNMDVDWWKKLFTTYKHWGLNAVRFHSWCPPEAAFTAADEVGLYLRPEVDEWCSITTARQDSFLTKESRRILRAYGNHPSFVMLALGNERRADSGMLSRLLNEWRKDDRRIYTGKSGGSPILDNFQFYDCGQVGPLRIRYHKGWPPDPPSTLFNTLAPQTTLDFRKGVAAYDKPLIAHEIGQRCAYPAVLKEIPKYTGLLKAAYLEMAKDQLELHGLLHEVPKFVRASGLWQVQLYKEEIEASLRTPGLGGFSLLSLEDFPGQSTAPVGLLDVFYDRKSYADPDDFRQFCGPVVLLARMKKRVWETNETFQAGIELYNFGEGPLIIDAVICTIKDSSGRVVYRKTLAGQTFPLGNNLPIGTLSFDLNRVECPAKYTLTVAAKGTNRTNQWDFWVFPHEPAPLNPPSVIIAHAYNDTVRQALQKGKSVLLLPDTSTLKGRLPICFTGFYWTAFGLQGGESSGGGIVCDPHHPVFDHFPTSFHTDWQWWDMLTHARPMILDGFNDAAPFPKDYQPLIQVIDSWKVNRKLGVLLEGQLGKGKLMICSIDIEHNLDKRPAARQFRYSLLRYMQSSQFQPKTAWTQQMIRNLFR